jgi:hypothetical protein
MSSTFSHFENPLFFTPLNVFCKIYSKSYLICMYLFSLKKSWCLHQHLIDWVVFFLKFFLCVCAFHTKLMTLFYLIFFTIFDKWYIWESFTHIVSFKWKPLFFTKDYFPCKCDAPPNYLRNPNVGFRTKQWKKKRVRACSLICCTSKVKRCAGAPGWD